MWLKNRSRSFLSSWLVSLRLGVLLVLAESFGVEVELLPDVKVRHCLQFWELGFASWVSGSKFGGEGVGHRVNVSRLLWLQV